MITRTRLPLAALACLSPLLSLFAPSVAQAGPWARGEGQGFLSFSHEQALDDAQIRWTALYGEYGLSDRATLLLDIGQNGAGDGEALLAYQQQIPVPWENWVANWHVALGARSYDGDTSALARVGAGFGRGFSTGFAPGLPQSGWFSAEASVLGTHYGESVTEITEEAITTIDYLVLDFRAKLDLTVGLNLNDRTRWINTLRLSKSDQRPLDARLGTGIAMGLGHGLTLSAELSHPVAGRDRDTRAKLALWLEF